MPASPFLYHPGNTMAVQLALTDTAGAPLSDAVVTMTLRRADETTVDGQEWPADLTESDVSPGWYAGVLEPDLDADVGDRLTLVIEAVTSAGEARWTVSVPVLLRQA